MKKIVIVSLGCVYTLLAVTLSVQGRPANKKYIDKLKPKTKAEHWIRDQVKAKKCNACHIKGKPKKVRNPYGEKLYEALGRKKFVPAPPAVFRPLRNAINKVGIPK